MPESEGVEIKAPEEPGLKAVGVTFRVFNASTASALFPATQLEDDPISVCKRRSNLSPKMLFVEHTILRL